MKSIIKRIGSKVFEAASLRYNFDHNHRLPITIYRNHIGEYMHRWILVHPLGSIRLHHIRRPDADPDMHTHPFDFVSLILSGWYVEEHVDEHASRDTGDLWLTQTTYNAMDVNTSIGTAPHRIVHVSPGGVWTFVLTGPRVREWGFITSIGFMPHDKYLSRKEGMSSEEYRAKADLVSKRLEKLAAKLDDLISDREDLRSDT